MIKLAKYKRIVHKIAVCCAANQHERANRHKGFRRFITFSTWISVAFSDALYALCALCVECACSVSVGMMLCCWCDDFLHSHESVLMLSLCLLSNPRRLWLMETGERMVIYVSRFLVHMYDFNKCANAIIDIGVHRIEMLLREYWMCGLVGWSPPLNASHMYNWIFPGIVSVTRDKIAPFANLYITQYSVSCCQKIEMNVTLTCTHQTQYNLFGSDMVF